MPQMGSRLLSSWRNGAFDRSGGGSILRERPSFRGRFFACSSQSVFMPIRQSEPSGSTPPPAGLAAPAASPVHGGVPGAAAAASGTGQTPRTGQRETFAADELAIVLSNFDIGVIESITEYPRGSRKAP